MDNRLKIILILIFCLGALVIGRLFEIQILHHNIYAQQVSIRDEFKQELLAERGRIFLDNQGELYPLATNLNKYNLIADPGIINQQPNKGAEYKIEWLKEMAPYLGIEIIPDQQGLLLEAGEEDDEFLKYLARISSVNDHYEILKKNLDYIEVDTIKSLGLPGVYFEEIPGRYWPGENLFSQLIGFTVLKENHLQGQYGLEEYFNQELAGQSGWLKGERARGYVINSGSQSIQPAQDGIDLILTIDHAIQFITCQVAKEAARDYEAEQVTIIVLDPNTSAVLALCNYPDFNPNYFEQVKDQALFKNSAINDTYEPGSIFKIITMAGALDAGKVTPETTYNDKGYLKIDDYTIKNVDNKVYQKPTMSEVLEKSINTGSVYAAQELGRKLFRNYVRKFGFGGLTEIELPGEAAGNIDNLEKRADIYLATASFGQGLTVSPIQMVNAISAIANQGRLMKPYLISQTIDNGQKSIQEPKMIRQVISPQTASTLKAMMVSVLENGYGRRAQVKGYLVGGKTGTAQVAGSGGEYSEESIHSFVGFAPATNPRFAMLVKINNPQKGRFADSTAAPTFGKIAEFILKYYNVPPDDLEE